MGVGSYFIELSVFDSIMIYIFELSVDCSGWAEDCELLLHPASFFMFVFHVKNVSLLQGGAGRGEESAGPNSYPHLLLDPSPEQQQQPAPLLGTD